MVEQIYEDSAFRFTDPIRVFKANDPYYFEVDNIPLKQLQENCLWLKDQVRKVTQTRVSDIKRADIDELRPYATGGDRMVRVLPGRYTGRINDASDKTPLAYLQKVHGDALGEVGDWDGALPNPGSFPNGKNAVLEAALDQFKSLLSQDALGMTGLVERAFTWPVVNSYQPVNFSGVSVVDTGDGGIGYAGPDSNVLGYNANYSPMVIAQALVWAKSVNSSSPSIELPSYDINNPNSGFAQFPKTESYFIKRWRGVSRLAIVDIPEELSIEVPSFDPDDFAYTNSDGTTTQVAGVQSRVDMIFIYSKPVDSSGVNILKPSGKQKITKPQLGIVQGAGIRANFEPTTNFDQDYITTTGDNHKILAAPGDQNNPNLGFTAASGNDVASDIRGSFPAPDDILNLAPLISEKLESNAYELVGQTILPIAYVWVQNGSVLVLDNDVIDIRPFFRTAELAYNERAGIAAAFPQLSLANPAVGKGQLDLELSKVYNTLNTEITNVSQTGMNISQNNMASLATGYVFGGFNFGPEGALLNFIQGQTGEDAATIRENIASDYAYGSADTLGSVTIPNLPDWDRSMWCNTQEGLENRGDMPNDYINTFIGNGLAVRGGSNAELTRTDGTNLAGTEPAEIDQIQSYGGALMFHYISKKIFFDRPTWLADYAVDVEFINCIPQTYGGRNATGLAQQIPTASYTGHWVEKGEDYFTIYVAFAANAYGGAETTNVNDQAFPAPWSTTVHSGGKKKKKYSTVTVSQRDGARFSSFIVGTEAMITSNTDAYGNSGFFSDGYEGNPRMGICTYPTVSWNFRGIPTNNTQYHYGNLSQTNPSIELKQN